MQSTHKHGHILDWVIVESNFPIFSINVTDKNISDHYMITFELNVSKLQREKRTIISRNLKAIDSYSFTSDLFDKFLDFPYSHDKVNSYYQFTRSTLDTHAPEKERTVTARLSAPWMTDELKDGKRERGGMRSGDGGNLDLQLIAKYFRT